MAANSVTQIPPDSTGDRLQMMARQEGAQEVLLQGVHLDNAQNPHYIAFADSTAVGAFAASKNHISLVNAAGSGRIVVIHDIKFVNLQLTAVSGVGVRFNVNRITTHSAGTLATPEKMDTIRENLPAGITVRAASTATPGALLWAFAVNNDEIPLTGLNGPISQISVVPSYSDPRAGKLLLREGEGIVIQQITSTTVGTFAWLIQFSTQEIWS